MRISSATSVLPRPQTAGLGRVATVQFSGDFYGQRVSMPVSLYFSGALRKLMSYNAENFYRGSKGVTIKDPQSVQALADVILQEDPDVIALQEVGDRALLQEFNRDYLKGKYPNIVSFPYGLPGGIRVAMMAKRQIKVVDAKSHWAEQCGGLPDCGKRDFLEATFETDTGYRFTVYDAHCKSMVGSATRRLRGRIPRPTPDEFRQAAVLDEQETMPVRMKEVETAARIVKRQLKDNPKAHVFVAGDFNALHTSPYGKPVIETLRSLNDQDPGNDFSEVMLKDGRSDPTHQGKGIYPDQKLDYTFVSPALLPRVRQAYVAGALGQDPWRQASDHLPLVTVFEEPDRITKKKTGPRFGQVLGQMLDCTA